MAANKVAGIRAAHVSTESEAILSREHNDANVLALGARVLHEGGALKIVDRWLATGFLGGRHARRVEKIMAIENSVFSRQSSVVSHQQSQRDESAGVSKANP
jgi:ribose 5-phosphate isomerase B